MKILIISDTHDNLINLKKCLEFIKQQDINILIHAGDISKWNTLWYLRKNFNGQIYICLGNMDINPDDLEVKAKKLKNLKFYPQIGHFSISNKSFILTHKPEDVKKIINSKIQTDYVICGHTHLPWLEKINQTLVINPGTLSGMFSRATFCVLDIENNQPELILLEKI